MTGAGRRLRPLLAAGLMLLACAPARAEVSLLSYLSIKGGSDAGRKESLRIYLAGVLEALLTFNELNRSVDVHLICIPQGVRLDLDDFERMIERTIETTRAEQADFATYAEQANISVIGLAALNRDFPCTSRERGSPP